LYLVLAHFFYLVLTHFLYLLTLKAAEIFNVPISLISLVDRDRQWFKSSVGLREVCVVVRCVWR
jgi:hypothetical protein